MPAPTNRMSYRDIFEKYDQALEDPKGIRLVFTNETDARNYRTRMHNARTLDRRENARTYPEGDVMHGQSAYDVLQCIIRYGDDEKTIYLYVEPRDKNSPEVELLSDVEAEEDNADG